MTWLANVGNAWSQLLNACIGGEPNESISGRAYRQGWGVRHLINAVFFWQENHCRSAFMNEHRACVGYLGLPLATVYVPASVFWRRFWISAAIGLLLAALALLLAGCADAAPAPRTDAQSAAGAAATRAAVATGQADAAAVEAAQAEGAAAAAETLARETGTQAAIDAAVAARVRAAEARAVATALARHAAAADAAAAAAIEQARREREAEARAALEREAQADRTRTRAVAGIVLAGCIAAAAALLWLGLRSLLWIPAAAAAGAIALAAWASVPWLPAVLGLVLAATILGALAWALRWAIREWRDYADGLARAMPDAKTAHDHASLGRQPRALRPLISALLGKD